MKAILEFNLPEDRAEYELANEGSKWHTVCWDMDEWFTQRIKYGELSRVKAKMLEEAKAQLRELMNLHEVWFKE